MPEPPPALDGNQHAGAKSDRTETAGTPRWVKTFGIVFAMVILLLIVVLLAGGGPHGPARHSAPASVTEYGAQQGYGVQHA